jgi:hypothetical protein
MPKKLGEGRFEPYLGPVPAALAVRACLVIQASRSFVATPAVLSLEKQQLNAFTAKR